MDEHDNKVWNCAIEVVIISLCSKRAQNLEFENTIDIHDLVSLGQRTTHTPASLFSVMK